jgi:hypothetical protein
VRAPSRQARVGAGGSRRCSASSSVRVRGDIAGFPPIESSVCYSGFSNTPGATGQFRILGDGCVTSRGQLVPSSANLFHPMSRGSGRMRPGCICILRRPARSNTSRPVRTDHLHCTALHSVCSSELAVGSAHPAGIPASLAKLRDLLTHPAAAPHMETQPPETQPPADWDVLITSQVPCHIPFTAGEPVITHSTGDTRGSAQILLSDELILK